MINKIFTVSLCIIFLIASTACSSATVIDSEPQGATVKLNGLLLGQTPVNYSDSKIIGATNHLEIILPGYKTIRTVLRKDEEVNVAAIIGAIFCLFPGLWAMGYRPYYKYQLEPGATVRADRSN